MNGSALRCVIALGVLALICVEPVLANKFETIGGGVSGSSGIKRDWLQKFFLVIGGMSLLSAILALVVPHDNALYLNYGNWKRSFIILLVLSLVFFSIAGLL
jgi:hypothetical protein